jgi:hypothetical protein
MISTIAQFSVFLLLVLVATLFAYGCFRDTILARAIRSERYCPNCLRELSTQTVRTGEWCPFCELKQGIAPTKEVISNNRQPVIEERHLWGAREERAIALQERDSSWKR